MTELFDEIDDILNGAPDEAAEVESPALSENNYNETELHSIITEIENLEKEFSAQELDEIEEIKEIETPQILDSTPQIEDKKIELQAQIDQEMQAAMPMSVECKEECREEVSEPVQMKEEVPMEVPKVLSFEKKSTPEISFEAQGQMSLNLGFKIGDESAKLTIDPVKGLIVVMSGVELCINEIDGCKVTMDSGVKFVIPLTTADSANKKKSA
jgi:hypothetical protein